LLPSFLAAATLELRPGDTLLDAPLIVKANTVVRGHKSGSRLVMKSGFRGSAAVVIEGVSNVTLSGFEIAGDRTSLSSPWHLPLREAAFADYYPANGILIRRSSKVTVRDVKISRVRTFAVLVNASNEVRLQTLRIAQSGTLNPAGRNNTTGGILFEEGCAGFEVADSTIENITGNAIWTHSYARSRRQRDGIIRGNTITTVGRDAIQVGHATNVQVTENHGSEIGFPAEWVDVENHGVGVALDTAGNVDHSTYAGNQFTDVNGQCIDLDGFHHGSVTGNSCINKKPLEAYPASHYGIVFGNNDPAATSTAIVVSNNVLEGFGYGALFLVGTGNTIENNRFTSMNRAHCGAEPVTARCNYALTEQPDLLRSGIYLAANGGRPAETKNNVIRGNTITGFGMDHHCIAAAPGVELRVNQIAGNTCRAN
jgi:hypothetical protein